MYIAYVPLFKPIQCTGFKLLRFLCCTVSRIIYYCILLPLSWLPLPVLYLIADLFYLVLRTVFPYRKDVALPNLHKAFPEKNSKEVKAIFRRNHRHIADLVAEGLKGFSASENRIRGMVRLNKGKDADRLLSSSESAILLGSHCNNWELMILAQGLLFPQKAVGIGKPLSKAFMDKKFNERRERFGMQVVHSGNYREAIDERLGRGEKLGILVLADQAPHKTKNAYWTQHFGRETPFSFGAESMAHKYNIPVYYLRTRKAARGKYIIDIVLISAEPRKEQYGFIMERYVELLEQQIAQNPARWLWTHNRWKHAPPEDLVQVKAAHQKAFELKLGRTSKRV